MTQPDATPQGTAPTTDPGLENPDIGKDDIGKPEVGASGFPNDRRKRNIPIATDRRRAQNAAEKRKNSERRRLIDPTTCERDYNDEETDFMKAMDRYKRENRRPFPMWREVLEVLQSLGYSRVAEPTALPGGKREPNPNPAPVLVPAPVQGSTTNLAADNAAKADADANNRRKRNIPVAKDHRQASPADEEETEFMGAMDRYKRQNRRPFPTWSEVLEVLRSLGYRRLTEVISIPLVRPEADLTTTPAPQITPAPMAQPAQS